MDILRADIWLISDRDQVQAFFGPTHLTGGFLLQMQSIYNYSTRGGSTNASFIYFSDIFR